MTDKNIIVDDCGMHWVYSYFKGKIYCIEGETDLREKYNKNPCEDTLVDLEQNGYYADSFEDGVKLLQEYGYIAKTKTLEKIRCENCGYPKESNYISCGQCGADGW